MTTVVVQDEILGALERTLDRLLDPAVTYRWEDWTECLAGHLFYGATGRPPGATGDWQDEPDYLRAARYVLGAHSERLIAVAPRMTASELLSDLALDENGDDERQSATFVVHRAIAHRKRELAP